MGKQKNCKPSGDLYRCDDPELVAERLRCQQLLDKFNATVAGEDLQRRSILADLLDDIGEGSWIMPRFQCDYDQLIRLGRNSLPEGQELRWFCEADIAATVLGFEENEVLSDYFAQTRGDQQSAH
ncbi:maltose acetyltransferase domain-containing protein [Nocardia vinacea]|uniref:maltose acetyltransferase domain-containing protein n=1 Tax=Nocardia vinacea TaxID=96468 RepID=UPI0033E50238